MKQKGIVCAVVCCLLLSSCSLLPEEETFKVAPIIRDYEKEEFAQAECVRGDLRLDVSVSCAYVPVRSLSLSFEVGGIAYDEAYVAAGDMVTAGQLLVQLDLSDIEERIAAEQSELDQLTLRLAQLEESRQLALKRARLESGQSSGEAVDAVNAQFDAQKQALTDSRDIVRMRLEEDQARLDQRQLRAPIDGTVTYLRKFKEGDVSTVGERMVTVADSTLSLFRAETEYWDRFHPGDGVIVTAKKTDYAAVVMSEAELGLEKAEKTPGKKAYVYFALNEPTFDLEDNDRGTVVLTLDTREDVLCVPSGAVSVINGETVVYYQDENGVKAFKRVEAGLTANKMTEIISGLEEGELVIAE